jgi:plasmid stabilization system protein ParE
VAEPLHRVELTDSFLVRLESIEAFLMETGAASAHDALLAELRSTVVPNLARFPMIGRRYIDRPPESAEALEQLAKFPRGTLDGLRVHLHRDYLLFHLLSEDVVRLLSIRHHRQPSFDFMGLWPA